MGGCAQLRHRPFPQRACAQRGTRADQRHVALQHIKELRELIKAGAAEPRPDRGHSGVPLHGLADAGKVRKLGIHGAEFVDGEQFTVLAEPLLPEQYATRTAPAYGKSNGDETRRQSKQPRSCQNDVHQALQRQLPALLLRQAGREGGGRGPMHGQAGMQGRPHAAWLQPSVDRVGGGRLCNTTHRMVQSLAPRPIHMFTSVLRPHGTG